MSKKNEVSILMQAQEQTNVVTANLENAVSKHAGESAMQIKTDSDGKEYVSATFKLAVPTKKASEIVVNDIATAQALERMKKQIALGEVATFALCKELYNFADTEASKLGFDSTTELAVSLFGLGKSTIGNYRRIGQYFIADDLTLRGAIPQQTSISLLNQLLSFVKKENEAGEADIRNVECLFKYSILTPYMKQKDYKRVISALNSLETSKELKDMTEEEVKAFKSDLEKALTPAETKEKGKEKGKEQEQEQEKGKEQEQAQEQESNDPQIIIGQAMSEVKALEDKFGKLTLTEEQRTLVSTWLDNLYTTLAEILG